MWTILGQPACSIAVPYWPVGETPPEANGCKTSRLCDVALKIKSLLFDYKSSRYIDSYKLCDGEGGGLWSTTFPAEDRIFEQADLKLSNWRKENPDIIEMKSTQEALASEALSVLEKSYCELKALKLAQKKTNNKY